MRYIFALLIGIFGLLAPVQADWINLSGAENSRNIAEIYVLDDKVKINLEIFVQDLPHFEPLIPDRFFPPELPSRPPLAQRMRRFSKDFLQILTEKNQRLQAKFIAAEARMRKDRASPFAGMRNPYNGRVIQGPPDDKRVLYVELEYPFTARPQQLRFLPPMDAKKIPRASIGFIAYHKSVPVIDFRYLALEAVLQLDWEDPWYSKFDNPNLVRHHRYPMMPFLYVEPYEVRQEVLARVRDLEHWIDLGIEGKHTLRTEDIERIKQQAGDFLLTKNPVVIDGKPAVPTIDRIEFVEVKLTGLQVIQNPESIDVSTAILGVILHYPTEGIPKEVQIDWELFPPGIAELPTSAVDPAGPLQGQVSKDDPKIVWKNFLKKYRIPQVEEVTLAKTVTPLSISSLSMIWLLVMLVLFFQARKLSFRVKLYVSLSAVFGGIALWPLGQVAITRPAVLIPSLTDSDSKLILESLLKNVYRSFDFPKEEQVYDRLALTVAGDLLTEVYLESRRSLVIEKSWRSPS